MNNELLEEALDKRDEQLKVYIDQRIVNALVNKQPGRSPDMLQMRLTEIAKENAPDADKLIIAAIADHYKDLANGFVYQHLSNVYRRI